MGTQSPESAHQVTWLMGDRGVPATWRHMNGYSSHTYMWVNAEGERFWVKYHFKTDRINPFDLTKVWPHEDYPLHTVGRMKLDRNPTDFHTEIEQAAFEPNNMVPGTGVSPDKMLLARTISYADAPRARLGVNYKQIPVNEPRSPVN